MSNKTDKNKECYARQLQQYVIYNKDYKLRQAYSQAKQVFFSIKLYVKALFKRIQRNNGIFAAEFVSLGFKFTFTTETLTFFFIKKHFLLYKGA